MNLGVLVSPADKVVTGPRARQQAEILVEHGESCGRSPWISAWFTGFQVIG